MYDEIHKLITISLSAACFFASLQNLKPGQVSTLRAPDDYMKRASNRILRYRQKERIGGCLKRGNVSSIGGLGAASIIAWQVHALPLALPRGWAMMCLVSSPAARLIDGESLEGGHPFDRFPLWILQSWDCNETVQLPLPPPPTLHYARCDALVFGGAATPLQKPTCD